MATIADLGYKSILDMTKEERLELIEGVRMRRRIPVKRTKKSTKTTRRKAVPKVNASQAAKILALLGGK